MSPLLANIALSTLDDHFIQTWDQQMATEVQRQRRKRHGEANYRLVRYADLCRARHKSAYADRRIMPRESRKALLLQDIRACWSA